jgi:hypothetical protein
MVDEAKKFLETLPAYGMKPNAVWRRVSILTLQVMYNTVLHAYAKRKDEAHVIDVFPPLAHLQFGALVDKMKEDRIEENEFTLIARLRLATTAEAVRYFEL